MPERNDDTNRYLVSYADMVTLLVGVFVVLSTTFRADADRYRQLARAASRVFGAASVLEPVAPQSAAIESTLARLSPTDVEHDSTTYRCILAEEVVFEPGSHRLSATAERVLTDLATILRNGTATITVDGHTDAAPPRNGELNLALSVERATVVAAALVRGGVPEHRLVVRGFGSSKPIAGEVASARNRRVEILIAFDNNL